jgi:hypothetical protein
MSLASASTSGALVSRTPGKKVSRTFLKSPEKRAAERLLVPAHPTRLAPPPALPGSPGSRAHAGSGPSSPPDSPPRMRSFSSCGYLPCWHDGSSAGARLFSPPASPNRSTASTIIVSPGAAPRRYSHKSPHTSEPLPTSPSRTVGSILKEVRGGTTLSTRDDPTEKWMRHRCDQRSPLLGHNNKFAAAFLHIHPPSHHTPPTCCHRHRHHRHKKTGSEG